MRKQTIVVAPRWCGASALPDDNTGTKVGLGCPSLVQCLAGQRTTVGPRAIQGCRGTQLGQGRDTRVSPH